MSHPKPSLLVMAAGMGSRFGGLKQVEPVGPAGETILDYSVFDAARAGFGRLVFVIRKDFEAVFRDRVGRRFEARMPVEYVFQELDRLPAQFRPAAGREKPWGTGHAVWCARGTVEGPFAVINADDFYGADAYAQMAAFFRQAWGMANHHHPAQFAMAGYRLADTLSEHGAVSRGVCRVDERGRLVGIEEIVSIRADGGSGAARLPDGTERTFDPATQVSMNFWGFSPQVFGVLDEGLARFLAAHGSDAKAEFYLPAAVAGAIAAGVAEVHVLPVRASWFGITHRDDKPRVTAALRRLIEAGVYPERLWD